VKPWKPPTAAEVVAMWTQADNYLVKERRDYWMNGSYYIGHQWIWWDFTRSIVQDLDYVQNADRESRITVDKYGPRTSSLLARFMQNELTWEVQPTGVDDSSMRRQRLQEQLLQGEQHHSDWESIREMTILQTLFGGAAAVCVDWDPDMGDDFMIDPINKISVPMGGVRLTPLGICDFTLEPGTVDPKDARWWIRCTALPPEQVQQIYNMEETPAPDAEAMLSARARSLLLRRPAGSPPRTTVVYVYYEKPSSRGPGCVVHVVNKKIVKIEEEWPFPFKHLNVALFRQKKIPNTWVGHTLLTPARDVQYAYNRARSTILEHMRKAANARLMVPMGSVDDADQITIDPADVLEYNQEVGEPHWQTAPEVPRWISGEAAQLEAELDDIFHTHQTTRGEAPGDRNSGLALSLLAEKDDTPLGPMAHDQSRGWGRIAEMVLSLYRMNAESTGLSRATTIITESGVPHTIRWNAQDIDERPRVVVPIDATMPRSKLATQSILTSLAQQFPVAFQNVDTKTLSHMLGLPDPKLLFTQMDPDAAKAEWENGLLVQQVAVVPEDFDVHDIHIKIHNDQRKSPAYELMSMEQRQYLDLHIQAHMQFLTNETAAQFAQDDMATAGEMPDPGVFAALNSGVGLPLPGPEGEMDMAGAGVSLPDGMGAISQQEMNTGEMQ
jgi:hypothetical protein